MGVTDFPSGFGDQQALGTDLLGTTYRAWQADPGRAVAVRILDLTLAGRPARRQFRSACLAAADLAGQPGVLPLYAVDFTAGHHPYLVTELPGDSLAQRLAGQGAAAVGEAAQAGLGLAHTLAAAHARGVLHQDVRPENVVYLSPATPVLANFGVARAVAAAGQAELAPELMVHAGRELFGWETPGPAADVYGLAATLYTMLAGQPAYAAEARLGRAALYQRVLRGGTPAIPRPDIPPALAELLAAMLVPDPAARPALAEVADALAGYATASPQPVPVPGRPVPAGPEPEPASPVLRAMSPPAPVPVPVPVPAPAPAHGPLGAAPVAPAAPAAAPPAPAATAVPAAAPPGPAAPATLPASLAPGGSPRAPQHRPPNLPERSYRGLLLLLGAGIVALLAGLVWGVVTAPSPRPAPTAQPGQASPATQLPAGQQGRYRVTRVRVSAGPSGLRVSWARPARLSGVSAFIVVAEHGGQVAQEHTTAVRARSVVFAGLTAGRRYCFVVGSLIESAAGQPATAAARPACTTVTAPG